METNDWIALFGIVQTIACVIGGAVLRRMIRTEKTFTAIALMLKKDARDLKKFEETQTREHEMIWEEITKNRDNITEVKSDVAVIKSKLRTCE